MHHFTPLAAQLLHHFNPSEWINPSMLHFFTPSQQVTHKLLLHFTFIGRPTSYLILPPLNSLPRNLTQLYPSWQLNSYLTVTPLKKLAPPSLLHHFTPLAAQFSQHFTPSEQITPHSYIILPSLAAQLLALFTPPWTNHPNSYATLPPLATQLLPHFTPLIKLPPPSLLHHFTPLAAHFLPHFPFWTNYPLNLTSL